MPEIHFDVTVKDGYIKIPVKNSGLNNKKVVVDIFNKDITLEDFFKNNKIPEKTIVR